MVGYTYLMTASPSRQHQNPLSAMDELLSRFDPISLKETTEVGLLNRFDTKYVFSSHRLPEILAACAHEYRVTTEGGMQLFPYYTAYFDTPSYDMFLSHHNGKEHRYKLRLREYRGFDLVFAEIKEKFKGKTRKHRLRLADTSDLDELLSDSRLLETIIDFAGPILPYDPQSLMKALSLEFNRVTLVHLSGAERITIDTSLVFSSAEHTNRPERLVIAEIKHEGAVPRLTFARILHDLGIQPSGFSKYCIGMIELDPSLKYNSFKSKQLLIKRLSHEQSPI